MPSIYLWLQHQYQIKPTIKQKKLHMADGTAHVFRHAGKWYKNESTAGKKRKKLSTTIEWAQRNTGHSFATCAISQFISRSIEEAVTIMTTRNIKQNSIRHSQALHSWDYSIWIGPLSLQITLHLHIKMLIYKKHVGVMHKNKGKERSCLRGYFLEFHRLECYFERIIFWILI